MIKFKLNGSRANQSFCVDDKFYKLDKGELPENAFKYAKKKFKIKEIKEKQDGK